MISSRPHGSSRTSTLAGHPTRNPGVPSGRRPITTDRPALVRRHHPSLAGFFRNAVADKEQLALVEGTFRRFSNCHEAFRRDASVRTHLFQIARTALLDHLRSGSHGIPRALDPGSHAVADISGSVPSAVVADLLAWHPMMGCLRALPIDHKQLLELYYWHGCSTGELGKIFGQPERVILRLLSETQDALLRALSKERDATRRAPDTMELEQDLRELGRLLSVPPR